MCVFTSFFTKKNFSSQLNCVRHYPNIRKETVVHKGNSGVLSPKDVCVCVCVCSLPHDSYVVTENVLNCICFLEEYAS